MVRAGLVTKRSRVRVSGPVWLSSILHPQYHNWGETLEQGTKPPTAPRAPQHWLPSVCVCVCVFHYSLLCVCTWMGEMQSTNSEYGSPYLATSHLLSFLPFLTAMLHIRTVINSACPHFSSLVSRSILLSLQILLVIKPCTKPTSYEVNHNTEAKKCSDKVSRKIKK